MISLKQFARDNLSGAIKVYYKLRKKQRVLLSNYGKEILDMKSSNSLISELLQSDKPFMVSRIGAVELSCIVSFLEQQNHNQIKFNQQIKYSMSNNAGFFPNNDESLLDFSNLFTQSLKSTDVLGVWYNRKEDLVVKTFCDSNIINVVPLGSIEPYYHQNPWSQFLKDKKVLVIHPFEDSIKLQYLKKDKLFSDPNMLPNFELKTLKAVQSIANTHTPYNSWFEAFEYMTNQIESIDFDVAIIGAGAYGLPLASHIKKIGKQAIHMGGATQIIFGIKGKRWDSHPIISEFYNEHWIRPKQSDTPKNNSKVEDGCYW